MSAVSIIGGGYVGLVSAACFAQLGHAVTCVESDPIRLAALLRGRPPIFEPGLSEIVGQQTRDGRLRFTGDCAAVTGAEAVFIAVNTPSREDGEADTSFVFAAVECVAPYLSAHAVLV